MHEVEPTVFKFARITAMRERCDTITFLPLLRNLGPNFFNDTAYGNHQFGLKALFGS